MGGVTLERFADLHQGGALADVTDWVHPLEKGGKTHAWYATLLGSLSLSGQGPLPNLAGEGA